MNVFWATQSAVRFLLKRQGIVSQVHNLKGRAVHSYHATGTTGVSTPLVLVHGLGGSANGFSRMLKPLTRHFRNVVAIDLPGNGFSPLPASGPLSLDEQQTVLEMFLESVVGRPTYLVGNSLGGALSVSVAANVPQRVAALALVAPAGGKVSEQRFQELKRHFSVSTYNECRQLMERLFHSPPWYVPLWAHQMKSMIQTEAVQHLLKDVRENARSHLEPSVLSGLMMPTLLLWGRGEKLLPYEGLAHFRAHLPTHAHIEEVETFGHVPQLESPLELTLRLAEFARTHRLD